MSETGTIEPTDRAALEQAVADDLDVTVHFDGCPLPGELRGVYADGTLDVHVHDEDGRYDGDHYVAARTVLSVEVA